MSAGASVSLTVPAEPASLERVQGLFESVWAAHEDITIGDRIRFETAAMELANNITSYVETDEFTLEVRVTPTEIVGEFLDWGERFDFDPHNITMPDEMAESGRGLALAVAALDKLSYHRRDRQNHWRLELRRSHD